MKKLIILLAVILLVIIVVIFSGKDSRTSVSETAVGIAWNCDSDDEIRLSDIADTVSLLPLETTKQSLIGEVSKLVSGKDAFYILDKNYMSGIFVFKSQTGQFVCRIGKVGNGPGEYNRIDDFSLDENQQVIYALCDKNKIITYTLSGDLVAEQTLPFFASAMEFWNETFYFVVNDKDNSNLIVTDKNLKVVSSYFPNSEYGNKQRVLVHPFQKTENGVYYRRFLDNNMYKINQKGELSLAYKIDLGANSFSLDEAKSLTLEEMKEKLKSSRCHIKYFTENSQYALIVFHDNNIPYLSVYDKREGTSKTSSLELPIDNFLGMEYVLPEYVSSNDEFIVVVAPEQANELASRVDMPHVSEDSNPVLYILHAKK